MGSAGRKIRISKPSLDREFGVGLHESLSQKTKQKEQTKNLHSSLDSIRHQWMMAPLVGFVVAAAACGFFYFVSFFFFSRAIS